jgi:hypothetical protein
MSKLEQKGKTDDKKSSDDCTIPGPVPTSVLKNAVLNRSKHEEQAIREYVEWQAPKEKVIYLEKIITERLFDRKLDAWDVRTDKERYWVITNPINLYSQELFPSLDYTISFHIGVTTRLMAKERTSVDDQAYRLAGAWRRWSQAAEALEQADEAEEFQAVGMRCRECLLSFIHTISDKSMVPDGKDIPQASNFIQWSELISNTIAKGSSAKEVRRYLKDIAKSTWQLVNWLTHASNAIRFDGHLAVTATQNTLTAFEEAIIRYETGTPDRCPDCSSYRLSSIYSPEVDFDPPYITICESCGWSSPKDINLDDE